MTSRKHEGEGSPENEHRNHKAQPSKEDPIEARLGGLPLAMHLTTVRGPVRIELDDTEDHEIEEAEFRVDGEEWIGLKRSGAVWSGFVHTEGLSDGEYEIELRAKRTDGHEERVQGTFRVRNHTR